MATILRVDSRAVAADVVYAAAQMLRDGLVVAFPTDTLYGLAVDPRNSNAVRRLYALKGRDPTSALPLIAADREQAELAVVFHQIERQLADRWWPGPLTIVAAARDTIASEVLAGGRTVGVRIPDHAVARALARALGFCVTATSANRSGRPPVATAEAVAASLPDLDGVLDGGASRGGAPSTIVEVRSGRVELIREGAVAWERVIRSLG
jgi:L-threonylcarbamoyladenylate synthase